MTQQICFSAVAVILSTVAMAEGADWGSLKGRFVVDGEIPKSNPLAVTKDQYCIDKKPIDETVVASDDGSLANVVIFIRLSRRDKIDVHPDYAAQLDEPVELDNLGCHFVPHVTMLRTGQPLVLKNSDPVGHNTNLGMFNQIIPAGGQTTTKISRGTPLPLTVNCNIHPFMKGYVLVQDHPYMAVSAADGTFEIKNLPAGEREFFFWHESPGPLKDIEAGTGKTGRRGNLKLTIPAGETLDLGEIKVPVALLKSKS